MQGERAVNVPEPSLISWDEVEAPEDVYQAVTLADGRPALVKGRPGMCMLLQQQTEGLQSGDLGCYLN